MKSSREINERQSTQKRRRAPGAISHLVATFTAGDRIPLSASTAPGPIQILLETTDERGTLAAWVHDDWFTKLLQCCGDEFVTLRIAPTPGALLHPCVLYEAEMVRRVVPHWRIVATAYVDDVQTEDDMAAIAGGPYHEIQFFDQPRTPPLELDRVSPPLSIERLFARLREKQEKSSGRTPILVRLPAASRRPPRLPSPLEPSTAARTTQLVDQTPSRSSDAAVSS